MSVIAKQYTGNHQFYLYPYLHVYKLQKEEFHKYFFVNCSIHETLYTFIQFIKNIHNKKEKKYLIAFVFIENIIKSFILYFLSRIG